jgi:hypothetical protein
MAVVEFGRHFASLGRVTDLLEASLATSDHLSPVSAVQLGRVYVDDVIRPQCLHPTCIHGPLSDRILSGITRTELARHGYTMLRRPPSYAFSSISDSVRAAEWVELTGPSTIVGARP